MLARQYISYRVWPVTKEWIGIIPAKEKMQDKTRVLMVCLGNICRSPLAEGLLKSKVDQNKVEVDSAGTGGYHIGERPDDRSIKVAQKYGIDISGQRCRRFQTEDFKNFDLIYVMDRANLSDIKGLADSDHEREKVKLLLDEVEPTGRDVPDPYWSGQEGFEKVYRLIDQACDAISKKLNEINRSR
jgi:protein-tyrosine phosphatase